jgi:hypothetical protein
MVDVVSSNRYYCSGGNFDLNCVLLNKKLQNGLQELKQARSIVALLQEDMNNNFYCNVKK